MRRKHGDERVQGAEPVGVTARTDMNWWSAALDAFDRFQQRHGVLGFPVAVWRKFSDDKAGNLAALISFYAFLSIFPLLLILITVLGMVLANDPSLQRRLLDSSLADFPLIGDQLKANIHSLNRSGFGLVVGIVGLVLGAQGLSNAARNAMDSVWLVPISERPGFPWKWLLNFGIIGVLGTDAIITTTLSSFGSGVGSSALGGALRLTALLASLVINILFFWLGFRLATSRTVPGRGLVLPAILSGVIWQLLQAGGTYLIGHQLRHASDLYGTFGVVLGLIFWLYLQARLTLYAVQASVVRTMKLWPRAMFPPPLTPQDVHAMEAYVEMERRRSTEQVEVRVDDEPAT
jgi:membrane protein